jgi:hypothetical protein
MLQSDLPRMPAASCICVPWYNLAMRSKDETPLEPIAEGQGHTFGEADNYRLSDVEREAVRQGIDAVRLGSFAPEEEMEEFYRLRRDD